VLGKPNVISYGGAKTPFPSNTSDLDFSPANAANLQTVGGAAQPAPPAGTYNLAGIDPQSFFLIGPPKTMDVDFQDPFLQVATGMTPGIPSTTPALRTPSMVITPIWVINPPTPDERSTGLTVTLRRLANPYLRPSPDPATAAGGMYNPYVTIDYLQSVPIQQSHRFLESFPSRGKRQPYAAYTQVMVTNNYPQAGPVPAAMQANPGPSPVVDQGANMTPTPAGVLTYNHAVLHTFGLQNVPLPSSNKFDWLVHLDRPVISPMELLHVSGYQPYQLTQQFIVPRAGSTTDDTVSTNMFNHYVPWLDGIATRNNGNNGGPGSPWWFDANLTATAGTQSHRLYRLFEFLECGDRAYGVDGWGRIPGRVNINTIWDTEILRALCDANTSLGANMNDSVIDTIFNNMLQSRTPSLTSLSSTDRPFLPLSIGLNQAGGTQYPNNGTSVTQDTLLRLGTVAAGGTTPQLLLFENPADANVTATMPYQHPYLQTQLLTKLYNNVTTRGNVFAVWLTIGFFEVTNAAATPPALGAEIGRSEGRHIRHRMFAIVDRTNLNVFSTTLTGVTWVSAAPGGMTPTPKPTTIAISQTTGTQIFTVTFAHTIGTNPNTGASWSIGAGTTLVFEPGTDNEETVVLQQGAMAGQLQATFYKSHATGVTVIQRGNPGPWTTHYDPRLDPLVVPYYSIIH
jgi:hypothetical protein